VSGRSLTELYAVGSRNGSNILFFDGIGWTPMVTDVQGPILSLQSVHVGMSSVYTAKRPNTFLEYTGAAWLEKSSAQTTVRSIWAGRDFAIAVGDGLFFQVLEKGQWMSVPYPFCFQSPFTFAVWGANVNDVWIVGPSGQMMHKTSPTTVTCVKEGDKWLNDVWGFAPNDIYAVGADGMNTEPNLLHYDGSTWQDLSDRVMPFVKKLGHVWGSGPSDVYVTGENKVLHFNGTTWSDAGLVTTHELSAIWGSSASDVYVVGSEGAIFHYDGAAWSEVFVPVGISIPTNPTLWFDIHGSGPNDIYVVGSRTLLHYDGTSWWPISRLAATNVEAVWAMPTSVITAGEAGIDARLVGRLQ
jgi:hypothetical protein